MNFAVKKLLIPVIVVLCIVSRLPQLLGKELILDGDECIVGLMAKHLYELKDIPLFFYGQAYGFSFIECLAILLFYAAAGISTLSVKMAMLCLWTTGVVFMYKAFLKICSGKMLLPFLLTMLLICCPAWAVWSMKARGGYLTSFMLSSVFLYCLFHDGVRFARLKYFLLGVLLVFIYESQPLWVPGLLPLFCYQFYKERSLRKLLLLIVPAAALFIFFVYYKAGLSHFYTAEYSLSPAEIFQRFKRIPYFLFSSLHGYYFSSQIHKPGTYAAAFAYVFSVIIFGMVGVAICNVITRRKGTALFNCSALGIVLTLCSTLLFGAVHPRYLLPVTGCTLLSVLLFVQYSGFGRKLFYVVCPVLLVCGIVALIAIKDFRFSTMKKAALGQLIPYLISHDVRRVYCYDYMLTYQLLFYSREQIVCRDRPLPGRYPAYVRQVDSAMHYGLRTAFIFNELQMRGMDMKGVEKYSGYMILFDPPRDLLGRVFVLKP